MRSRGCQEVFRSIERGFHQVQSHYSTMGRKTVCCIEGIKIHLYKESGKVMARSNNRHFNNAGKEKVSKKK